MNVEQLKKQLDKIEKELDKCRTSSFVDGFGTLKHAKKSRKWDYYAQEKMRILNLIDEYENTRADNK
jgi:6-phosphogluconate dehydrogenase